MPLLNYTTKIEAVQTAAEIMRLLANAGAEQTSITYGADGVPFALEFVIKTEAGAMDFRLPSRVDGVHQILQEDWNNGRISGSYAGRHHATRVAWRILKDWVEAQLALIQTRMVRMEEVFFPYHVLPDANGRTMFEAYYDHRKALGPGGQS